MSALGHERTNRPGKPPMSAIVRPGSTGRRNTFCLEGEKRSTRRNVEGLRGFTAAEETGDFGIAGSARKTLGFKPQQIESRWKCCVMVETRPPKADIEYGDVLNGTGWLDQFHCIPQRVFGNIAV